ncbi:hypothetical protein [Streptomyces radiopugnans]
MLIVVTGAAGNTRPAVAGRPRAEGASGAHGSPSGAVPGGPVAVRRRP